MCLAGVRHSAEYGATGQVAPTNTLQRGKSDGRWPKRGHSSEVPEEGSAQWLEPETLRSLLHPTAEQTEQLEECLDVTADRAVRDTPLRDRPTGP